MKFGHLTMIGKIKEEKGLNFNIEDGLRTYRYKNYNYIPKNPLMFKVFNKRMEKLYKEIVKKEGQSRYYSCTIIIMGRNKCCLYSKKI